MPFAPNFSRLGRVYLTVIVSLGFLAISQSLLQLYRAPLGSDGLQWILLAVLTLVSGSASIELPRANVSISISEAFVFTAVLLYGPAAGTLTVALDGLVISFWVARRRPELHRALFNIAAPALSAWCSAQVFFRISGISPLSQAPAEVDAILPALIIFAVVYFGLNSWLIALVIALQNNISPVVIWRRSLVWLSLNYFCGASVAMLLVGYNRTIDLRFVGVVVPLLLVLYFTFKTSTQRVEDANRHLEELNTLYLSTIETLAMAIDAKDQVTHGHIRRVQSFAMGLARHIGVRDDSLIKAIEAAALLHDMGKLAVPEYVLNKPGKLTETEFEKMKAHASIGADILSAIDFPYPVVPIVRHHHENWDGSGYPDGLRGTQIPIGARILSVVDCFDALTSDRPYRPKLSDAEALNILMERRNTMYDPLVVDTFVRVHDNIRPQPVRTGPPTHTLEEIAIARKNQPALTTAAQLDEIAASTDEMLTLYELASALAGQVSVNDAGDIIATHLRRLVPFSLAVFYSYDARTNELEAKHVIGDGSSIIRGIRIPLGQRVTGWVAAHRHTIVNSDATLDLGDAARSHALGLRTCLSAPLIARDELVGALALYSTETNGFADDHRRIVDIVANQIAHTVSRSFELDKSVRRDSLTGLPDLVQLEHVVHSANDGEATYALLFIDIVNLKSINTRYGRSTGDEALRHVVRGIRGALRIADILFRHMSDEFVVFLSGTDADTATTVADRISERLADDPLRLSNAETISLRVTIRVTCSARDRRTLSQLLASARLAVPEPTATDTSVH